MKFDKYTNGKVFKAFLAILFACLVYYNVDAITELIDIIPPLKGFEKLTRVIGIVFIYSFDTIIIYKVGYGLYKLFNKHKKELE